MVRLRRFCEDMVYHPRHRNIARECGINWKAATVNSRRYSGNGIENCSNRSTIHKHVDLFIVPCIDVFFPYQRHDCRNRIK